MKTWLRKENIAASKLFIVKLRSRCFTHALHSNCSDSEVSSLIECLNIGVASNVLSLDEDVGNSSLASHLLEFVLNVGTIGHLVQFHDFGRNSLRCEKIFSLLCEWAVALRVDHDVVSVDFSLNLSFEISSVDHLCF